MDDAEGNEDETESWLGVPIIVGDKVLGAVSVQSYKQYAYKEDSVRLLQTLSANMGVAIENARLFEETTRLLKETEERNAELAVINSVQLALAAQLDMQGIYDAVGDKIRDIFDAQGVIIGTLNYENRQGIFNYFYEKGERYHPAPVPFSGLMEYIATTGEMIVINENMLERVKEYRMTVAAGEMALSGVWMPFKAGNIVRGIIALQNVDRENAFSDSDVRLLQTLANSMSVAIENARLFDETQRLLKVTEDRAAELSAINSVQAVLAEQLDLQIIVDLVGDKIREIFHNTDMNIRIYDPKTNLLHIPYLYENGIRINLDSMQPMGYSAYVLRTREMVVVNENIAQANEKYGAIPLPGTQKVKSAVYVPLVTSDQARGLINLINMEREHAFSESDVRLLQTLANSISVALENARLFNETQRLLKVTEDRAAELAILNTVGEAMAKTLDVKSVTYNVGDKVREIFNAEIVDILMFDPVSKMVNLAYSYYGQYFENEPPWELGEGGLTSKIISTRQPLLLSSAQEINDNGAQAYITAPDEEDDPQSYMGVPIMVGEKVLGVVDVQSTQPNAFDENNLRLLQTLSSNMGIALENARLFDEIQTRNREITEALDHQTATSEILRVLASSLSRSPACSG